MAEAEKSIKGTENVANTCLNTCNSAIIAKIKKITTLLFDLDNTLIPTRSGDLKAVKKLAEVLENQFAFTKEESTNATQSFLKAFRRCPDNSQTSLDSWRSYLWREALPARFKHLAEQIYAKWLQLRYRYLALTAEYIQMLKRFREAGFLLALITNGPSNAQWEKINKLHVSQYFDCVLVSSDLPWEKPSPHIFYAACNFLGVAPEQCAMIGDKLETDIKGGCAANVGITFWVPLNLAAIDLSNVAHKPDVILKQLLDIYKYFPTLNATRNTSTNASTNGLAAATNAPSPQNAHQKRRSSQISHSRTTSTCYSDMQFDAHCEQSQDEWCYQQGHLSSEQSCNRQRRGGSLPAIECLNSETESSSDSMFG